MWATLIQLVATTLRTELSEIPVLTHGDAALPDSEMVIVKRGGSPTRHVFVQQSGVENLVLECWTHNEDPDAANVALEVLEERVIAALRTLPRSDPVVNLTITGIDPDGDYFRPTLGSQISIQINWRALRT